MEHEGFPVPGFEFMNEPASDEQKDTFCDLTDQLGQPVDRNGPWPESFSKWDCGQAIDILKEQVAAKKNAEPKWWALLTKERDDRNECMKMLSGILEDFEGQQDIPHFIVRDLIEAFTTQLDAYRMLTNLVREAIVSEQPETKPEPEQYRTAIGTTINIGGMLVHLSPGDVINVERVIQVKRRTSHNLCLPCQCVTLNDERYHHPHCTAFHTTSAVGYVGGESPDNPTLFRGIWPHGTPVET